MKIYNKHLKSYSKEELNEISMGGIFKFFKKAISLLTTLLILKNAKIDEYSYEEKVDVTLDSLDDLLKHSNIDPVYKGMVGYGVITVLKELGLDDKTDIDQYI